MILVIPHPDGDEPYLDEEEKQLIEMLDEPGWVSASPEVKEWLVQAAKNTVRKKKHVKLVDA